MPDPDPHAQLVDVPPMSRAVLRPLYEDYPGGEGIVDAVLEGTMGAAFADDAVAPRVALLSLEFQCIGGDASATAAATLVRHLPRPCTIIIPDESWAPLLGDIWGVALSSRQRVEFRAGAFDRAYLSAAVDSLPDGYAIKRIGVEDVARFADFEDSLVYNFPSLDAFVARGIGFGIEQGGQFVAGCSSFAISSKKLEFEIQTHLDFRLRGLAFAAASRMILHCLDAGLTPCWDAHNEPSARLATKLGFVDPQTYVSYQVAARGAATSA